MRFIFLICITVPSILWSETIRVHPKMDWFQVLHGNALKPGDEIILAPGTYSSPRRLEMRHRGTRENPIIIRGPSTRKPGPKAVIRRPDARQNSINMTGVQHLVLKDIEITGGSSAIRISKSERHPAHHVRIENLHIYHIHGVAITCNHAGNTYAHMHFVGNEIHHTGGHGEAFYLGGNNAEAIFHSSIIERNYIHHLNGPNISQGDGIELKPGSWGNTIRDNVILKTKYPGIIVYGTHGKQPNLIERNVIFHAGDHGIQAAADAIIQNNVIIDPRGNGIHTREHQGIKPGNLNIRYNTIIHHAADKELIRIIPSQNSLTGPVTVFANALYPNRMQLPDLPQLKAAHNTALPSPSPLPLPNPITEIGGEVVHNDIFRATRNIQDGIPGAVQNDGSVPTTVNGFITHALKELNQR